MTFRVRQARKKDIPAIEALWEIFRADVDGPSRRRPRRPKAGAGRHVGTPDHLWWIASWDGRARGFLHAVVSRDDDGVPVAPFLEIVTLVVDRESRRRGAARLLVRAAEAWARRRRFRWLRLVVRNSNAGAVAFYEDAGFATWMRMMQKRL